MANCQGMRWDWISHGASGKLPPGTRLQKTMERSTMLFSWVKLGKSTISTGRGFYVAKSSKLPEGNMGFFASVIHRFHQQRLSDFLRDKNGSHLELNQRKELI